MRVEPRTIESVRVSLDVPARMRDGTTLRANVYQPDDPGAASYPVLLTRLPYGKDLPLGSSALLPEQAARRGYVVVIQDVRGTFASEGEWFPFLTEAQDGYDTVEWAARLPGANGQVGMYGVSYFGFTQWAAASQHPPALRALLPMHTWSDTAAGHTGVIWRNGVLELGNQAGWLLETGLAQLPRRFRDDPQALGRALYELAREIDTLPAAGYGELPLHSFGPLLRTGFDAPLRRAIEARRDPLLAAEPDLSAAFDLPLPALHIGGWFDIFQAATIANFQRMRAAGNDRQWLLLGPWTHGNVNRAQGDVDFGFASSGALLDLQVDLMSLSVQFFDHTLKGVPNLLSAMPTVKYFVMGSNVWKGAATWPPDGVSLQAWYLSSGGRANTLDGDGALSPAFPAGIASSADHYTYDPAAPVPTLGGAHLLPPVYRRGPVDQRPIERRHDMLVYTSAALEHPVEIAGPVTAKLFVTTDAADTDFVARLIDVYPDGRAIPLADGIARLSLRDGVYPPAAVTPGALYQLEIDLWSTANVFLPGHRIRLDVTSSSFPRWERNLGTGADSARSAEMRPAHQHVLHDADHPSHVLLPIAPADA